MFFNASFTPKAVGHFEKPMQVYLINKEYTLNIKVLGIALDISQKETIKRGLEIVPEDFNKRN